MATLHEILEPLIAAGVSARDVRAIELQIAAALERCRDGGEQAISDFLADSPIPWAPTDGGNDE